MAQLVKLTSRHPQEGFDAAIWVNLDLVVSLTRAGDDRTIIDFTAPRWSIGVMLSNPGFDTAPRRIEVVETPDEIASMVR